MREIHDNSLIVLYRLLFTLYAEARDLLPVGTNTAYRDSYSLAALKRRVASDLDAGRPAVASMSGLWQQLSDLWRVIDTGDNSLGVPAYNGGLFDPDKHPFLERVRCGDLHLRRAIDLLGRTVDPRTGKREFVDYRDLEIRHLGSIYEGLLEYQLRAAEEPLVVRREKGREVYAPANGAKPDIAPGQLCLVNDKGERKSTGSYYTPDYIVQYIVEHAIGPVLDEVAAPHLENPEALARAVLGVNVLDPAMGSGHFLVAAADFIARFLVELGLHQTFEVSETSKVSTAEGDLAYWRRRVAQACIYGVDLNPLAVELAKLSLWLATVSHDRPLSFLDHHLRCGNSLIGALVADLPLQGAPTAKEQRRARKAEQEAEAARAAGQLSMLEDSAFAGAMRTASRFMGDIERLGSETLADVEESERIYRETVRGQTDPARRLADLWTARHFGLAVPEGQWAALAAHVLHGGGIALPGWDDLLADARRIAAERRFFHWELEFPEVFFDEHGRLREGGGFDAVIGNPPWVAVDNLLDVEKTYYRAAFSVGQKFDLAHVFTQLGITLSRNLGYLSMVIPEHSWIGEFHTAFRSSLIESGQLLWVASMKEGDFSEVANPASMFGLKVDAISGSLSSIHNIEVLRIREPEDVDARRSYNMSSALLHDDVVLDTSNEPVCLYRIFFDSRLIAIRAVLHRTPTTHLDTLTVVSDGIKTADALHQILHEGELGTENRQKYTKALRSGAKIPSRYGSPQWDDWWILKEEYTRSFRQRSGFSYDSPRRMYCFNAESQLIMRQTEPTIIATIDREKFRFPNSIFTAALKSDAQADLSYVLAVLNSTLIREYYLLSSQVEGTTKPQLYINQLKSLPIRRISFTTPPDQRARLAEEGRQLYAAYCTDWDPAPLLAWVDTMLAARDLTGLPDLSGLTPERSDAVHDLLAGLAEQMIALHKARQAEMKGFLAWLEREIGAPLDSLTGKSQVRNYLGDYQKGEQALPFDDLLGILHKNSRKLKADPAKRAFQEELQREYGGSLATLTPIKARLAATDRLIDRVVYRLYGLTDEEIAVVEGRR